MGTTVCEGILIPLITPFDHKGEPDEPVLRELVEFMVKSGVDGLFILGSAGQGPVMTAIQRRRAAEAVLDQVKGRIPIVTHAGCADTETTVELAVHAKSIGSAAVAVLPPFYYSDHSDHDILEHFRAVASALGDYPLFLYDNSLYTGIHMTAETVRRYVDEIPTICGLKVSFIAVDELLKYVHLLPAEFGVFSGSIFNLAAAAPVGLKGSIHPPTSLFPELCVGLWEAIRNERWKETFEHQRKLYGLVAAMGKGKLKGKARAVLAAIARLRGFDVKRYPRWKTEELTAEEIKSIEAAADQAEITLKAV